MCRVKVDGRETQRGAELLKNDGFVQGSEFYVLSSNIEHLTILVEVCQLKTQNIEPRTQN